MTTIGKKSCPQKGSVPLTLWDIPSVPDQCRVDLSCNLRSKSSGKNGSKSSGKNSALRIVAVVNGRAANSFNLETDTLEYEPIELFSCKNIFKALSSINLNEGDDSNNSLDQWWNLSHD